MQTVLGNQYVQQILTKIEPLFRFVFFAVEIIAIVGFAAALVINLVQYFKHAEDAREQKEWKEKCINAGKGLAIAFVASILFNLILSLVGINIFQL